MIVKLKTWEEFEEEFKPKAYSWSKFYGYIEIYIDEMSWVITEEEMSLFGKMVEVERLHDSINYDYVGVDEFLTAHESWFAEKEADFITEEEFKI